ncbi:DHHC palmitoyltransferase-domain-containing protein [Dichomitus squalens]|uniref:Palmitoyltransferase n=1 Tax=Dichomitus squalens TaxID=114155 RepID=A0A4Q9MBB3_9APHY|nr:DHHC palmitoyltransferase-domain-containing protein [Dichomitus squalens]
MSRWFTRQVFRCFKTVERIGDRITGAAGPVFVALAVVLLSIGAFCFFEIIQPSLPYKWLTTPICIVIALNLFGHYYYVCTVPPGFVDDSPRVPGTSVLWAKKRRSARYRALTGVRWSEELHITRAASSKCRRCGVMRPEVSRFRDIRLNMVGKSWKLRHDCERSHHCRICNRCVLKYDHHCPVRINQCVGIHNERHFVLFLVYMVVSTACFIGFGWRFVLVALGWFDQPWPYLAPPVCFLLTFILAGVLCMAVTAMAGWHIYMIACGETSVESQDHEHYRRIAKQRGETFVNSYDMGYLKNLQLFFNTGQDGYPYYTLLLPLRVEPYTDGRAWARRPGLQSHGGVHPGEELTDEDEE